MTPEVRRVLDENIAAAIVAGDREVTMDTATNCGAVAADVTHRGNSKQNSLGHYLPSLSKQGLLERTDRIAKSRAPGRRGGTFRVWAVTPAGVSWARSLTPNTRSRPRRRLRRPSPPLVSEGG